MGILQRLRNPGVSGVDGIQTYVYEAVSPDGKRVKDRMTGTSAGAVATALKVDGWVPVRVEEEPGGLNADLGQILSHRELKFDAGEAAEFARQLYQLLNAGISMPAALASLAEEAEPTYAEMCESIAAAVTAGRPVSDAMADFPKAFDDVFRAYVRSGERAGNLDVTMGRLADMLQKRAQMQNKIKGVTAYPKGIAIALAVVLTALLLGVVPRFEAIYASFGAELPAPTQFVVAASKKLHYVLLAVGGAVIWTRRWVASKDDDPVWAARIDRFIYLRMPLVNDLTHKTALYRWASTLGGSMASGVPMVESLELAAEASGSRWIRAVTPDLARAVQEGRQLRTQLTDLRELFPANVRTMVATGEEAGELDVMLENVAVSLDSDVDRIVATLGARIEVALILVLGVTVGGLLAVLYLPVLEMTNAAMQGLQ